jgi:hypothetical protein
MAASAAASAPRRVIGKAVVWGIVGPAWGIAF